MCTYILTATGELVNASVSNGKISAREFADKAVPNGSPTHYGLGAGVDYGVDNVVENVGNGIDTAHQLLDTWTPRYSHLVFQAGCKGGGTREIQSGLNKLGYDLIVDGDFGSLTAAAVIQFQKEHDLDADGMVGRDIRIFLIRAVSENKGAVDRGQ